MSETISQRELRNDSGKIMRGLDEGKTYIVTRNGVAIGELRPYRQRSHFSNTADVIDAFRGLPRMDYAAFRRDLDEAFDQRMPDRYADRG